MAVTPTYVSALGGGAVNHVPGDLKEVIATGTVGAADTYVTNGFAISPAAFGLTAFTFIDGVTFSTGHWGIFVPASNLIKVFSAAGTELANASTALQSATYVIRGLGK